MISHQDCVCSKKMCHQNRTDKNFSEIRTFAFEKDLSFTVIFFRTYTNMNKSNKSLKVLEIICRMSVPMNNLGNTSTSV